MYQKYRARKKKVGNIVFDSQKEGTRYEELLMLARSGIVKDLQTQVKYELIPAHRRSDGVLERAVFYKADFVYEMDGKKVVEDVKGFRTKEYIIKRKLMLDRYGIEIKET